MFRSALSRRASPLVKSFIPQTKPTFLFRNMSAVKTSHVPNEDLTASKLFDVSHVVAVVTGGGTGIGLMIAQALQSNGAKVYITGRREDALDAVVKQYSTGPGSIHALPGDITKKEECIKLAEEVGKKESKGIHLLVNNAGIARDDHTKFSSAGQPDMKSADSISQHMLKSEVSDWQDTFETNLTAQFFMSAAFLPLLGKGRDVTPGYTSSIVNITSISGLMKGSSNGQFAYATSKAGFVHLTRMLATTLAETKIRVNQIAPGIFPSEMTTGESDESQKSELSSELSNPAGRGGGDADMAATILYLVGKGGMFLNNQLIHPEGGQLLVAPAAI
ncbi:short chain dehydrogenase/reductase [Exophiala viscosa]|uniref:Short chain dehydrogenase/reductase n=1 Tax=Exophiala viscosa TaxID=2486360 RepID=A0AAN6IAU3_9EURO|nr:short chain dehydrogenase/reductase [Exophiala viscosa]KAI1624752.1 short chain dehydrogenase/reductase [Exophiala viscosa]